MSLPPHLEALRDEALRTSCISWAIRKRWPIASQGIDRAGPCPKCGGKDRFSVHSVKDTFNCRRCGIAGHGVIDLVTKTEDVDFTRACEIITGRRASEPLDEARAEENRRQAAQDEKKRQADEAVYREKARRSAHGVWRRATGASFRSHVGRYLERRGIVIGQAVLSEARVVLKEIAEHKWVEKQGDLWVTIHKGPAMIACVQQPDGFFGAVHQTWIDLDQPGGKVVLPPTDDGKERPSKKVLGIKRGGAIRLYTPRNSRRIVMGEGIETTLTALAHNWEPDTAYWAGVDLGNMAGRDARDGEGGHLWDQPDMDDRECFLPPDWCEELIYLAEDDGPRSHSEEKCIRGLRRAGALRELARQENPALAPLLTEYVPPVGPRMDINDLVRGG